jgi:hypothetical protein
MNTTPKYRITEFLDFAHRLLFPTEHVLETGFISPQVKVGREHFYFTIFIIFAVGCKSLGASLG